MDWNELAQVRGQNVWTKKHSPPPDDARNFLAGRRATHCSTLILQYEVSWSVQQQCSRSETRGKF
jgi:hypothetical protein